MATEKRSSFLLDLRDLRNGFDAVDTERKGYIDFDGLKLMIEGMKGLDGSMAHELMDSLDRNKDGKVTFEDFQTLFTLQRDEVKHQLGRSEETTDSAVYVTALPSPDASPFSPERPPIPPGQKPKRRDSKGSSILQVPESPDLTTHARSLKGSILHSPQLGPRTLSLSSIESGDLLLEDVGIGIGDMPPSPSLLGSAKMAASAARSKSEGLRLIYNELVACCPTGMTNKEGVVQLCERLRYDPIDTQEMLGIWQELEDQAPKHVTIEMLCHSLREKETEPAAGAIVTSTPAVGASQQTRNWQEQPLKLSESFEAPIVHPVLETSPKQQTQQQSEEPTGTEMTTNEKSFDENTEFSFQDYSLHLNTASKEGSRLSRGPLSESSLVRPVASIAAIQKLQQELSQISQERDSLKLNLSRVEEEKRMLIKEGDEGFLEVVREKDDKIRKIEKEAKAKQKEVESSLTEERHQIEEKAQRQIAALENKLLSMKSDEDRMKGELEHYIEQKEWLDKELDQVREELVAKNKKIEQLQQTLDEKSEGGSEVDFLAQAARIQELESDRATYTELNEDLLESQRELRDKVDELKAENEQLKQKVIDEKRKRQRKKSASGTRQPPSGTKGKQKQGSEKVRRGSRGLPSTLSEDMEIEEREVVRPVDEDIAVEPILSGSEASEVISDSDDEMVARSSASLMEELQMENQRAVIGQKLEDLISQRSVLETSCNDLRSQLNNLKENKAALRQQIEQELRKKMYQHANLDKHIKHLSQLKDTLANARQAFSSQLHDSEQYLTQYLEGLETDINQFISEDAELGMAHREDTLRLTQRVKELEEELELTKNNTEITEKEVQALKETCIAQQANLAKAEEENEALVAQHNTQLARLQYGHTEEVENLNRALRKETAALEELQGQVQAQKSESERALSRLSSSVDVLEAEKKLIEAQHAAEIQKMEEAMVTEKAELEKQLGASQQELQLLHEANQKLESTNIDLHSKLVSLQEEYSKMEEHSEEQIIALQQQLVNLKENSTRDLEKERQLKTLQAELALAIHDLTAKEQECWELQEKVDQIEEGLNDSEVEQLTQDLENLRDQRHELQNQLKSTEGQLVEGRDQLLKANQENAQLKLTRDQLNDDLARSVGEADNLRQQLQKMKEEASKKRDEQSGEESTDAVILNAVPIEEPVLEEVRIQESYELLLPSSMLDQSANTSYSSQDNTQHEEIVKQMKSQLEELQSILIGRHPDDSTSSELSLVQELLASNQSLHAQLRQRQPHQQLQLPTVSKASEMATSMLDSLSAELVDKVDQLGRRITVAAATVSQVQFTLEERDARHMSALDGLLENSIITPVDANIEDVNSSETEKKIESMETEANILRKEVETLNGQKMHLEKALSEQSLAMDQQLTEAERKISHQEEIIQRMKLEMEKLNYHLGKAKSLQNHYDDDRLETSKQLEDQERELLNKSHEIEQLREEVRKVFSPQPAQVDTSNQLLQTHEAELLMQQESLQAAEELISTMRYHLNDIYQVLINPSDSSAYDVLEVTELFQHIRDAVETLKATVSQEEEARQEAEESLKQKTEDYDLLYSEHEDEVMAVLQQKQQLQLLLEDLQGRYQNLMAVHGEQAHEHTQLLDLQKQKNVLIDLVQTLSLQAVSSII